MSLALIQRRLCKFFFYAVTYCGLQSAFGQDCPPPWVSGPSPGVLKQLEKAADLLKVKDVSDFNFDRSKDLPIGSTVDFLLDQVANQTPWKIYATPRITDEDKEKFRKDLERVDQLASLSLQKPEGWMFNLIAVDRKDDDHNVYSGNNFILTEHVVYAEGTAQIFIVHSDLEKHSPFGVGPISAHEYGHTYFLRNIASRFKTTSGKDLATFLQTQAFPAAAKFYEKRRELVKRQKEIEKEDPSKSVDLMNEYMNFSENSPEAIRLKKLQAQIPKELASLFLDSANELFADTISMFSFDDPEAIIKAALVFHNIRDPKDEMRKVEDSKKTVGELLNYWQSRNFTGHSLKQETGDSHVILNPTRYWFWQNYGSKANTQQQKAEFLKIFIDAAFDTQEQLLKEGVSIYEYDPKWNQYFQQNFAKLYGLKIDPKEDERK